MTSRESSFGQIVPIETLSASDDVSFVMYIKNGKEYNLPDSYLAKAYRRTVIESTIHKIFFDGSINHTEDFVNFFKQQHIKLIFVNYKGKEAVFFWLSPFVRRSSFITYCLYKNFLKESLVISQACIDKIFDNDSNHVDIQLDTLLGLTPVNNKLALKFLEKNGMEIVGTIPGIIYDEKRLEWIDGVLTSLSRSPTRKKVSFDFLGL